MQGNEVVDLQKFRSPDSHPSDPKDRASQYLPAGTTLLVGQYIIDGYLNCGGFGITYTARDSLGRRVVIKECFPGEMVYRDGKAMKSRSPKYRKELVSIVRNFVTEAHSLANVKHANIVHVHQIFEENGTAYLAMDFVNGPDLLDLLESDHRMPAKEVERLTRQILDAIRYLHRIGMLHRDISPDNILVQRDGTPVLIDFGAARHFASKDAEATPIMKFVKDGYSPQEFYVAGSPQGPASDLYALAATVYHLLTGAAPVDAQTRLAAWKAGKADPFKPSAETVKGYPARFLRAVDKALALMPEDRLQSADVWLDYIGPGTASGLFKPVTAVLESFSLFDEVKPRGTAQVPARQRPLMVAGLAGAALLVGGVAFVAQLRPGPPLQPAEPTPASLAALADLPQPAPFTSVWPDGFAALRAAPPADPAPAFAMPNAVLTLPSTTPGALADIADLEAPVREIALVQPDLTDTRAPKPPAAKGIADGNGQPARLGIALEAIAPVSLDATVSLLPAAPAPATVSVDTSAPNPLPAAAAETSELGRSAWDIALPFTSRPQRIGDGNALVITGIAPQADLSLSGEWIEEGLILVGLNGAPLRDDTSLRDQLLETLTIKESGHARASLFYRAPREDVLEEAVLTIPVVRLTTLSDGTSLETRKRGASWITTVTAIGAADTDLRPGDIIIGNASNPTRFTSHETVASTFNALSESKMTTAEFSVLRAGQRQSARWRFDPAARSATGPSPKN